MSKVLLDTEALQIISNAILKDEIDDAHQYARFLEDLGRLVADHFGGEFVCTSGPLQEEGEPDETRWCLHFKWNENVPEGGGVYAEYDTDISVEEWIGQN